MCGNICDFTVGVTQVTVLMFFTLYCGGFFRMFQTQICDIHKQALRKCRWIRFRWILKIGFHLNQIYSPWKRRLHVVPKRRKKPPTKLHDVNTEKP